MVRLVERCISRDNTRLLATPPMRGFARPTFGTATNTTVLYFQCSISSALSPSTVGISLKLRELGQRIGSGAGKRCKHSRIQAVGQGPGHFQLQQYFVS